MIGDNYSPPQRHDRILRQGGGVAVWFHSDFCFKVWNELISNDFETMWFTVWSHRMPRDCSRVILGVIYYTGSLIQQHRDMANHIINAVDSIRRIHPYAKVILTGDFNQLPDKYFAPQLSLKQTVTEPTRNGVILDKLFTDMLVFYPECMVTAPVANSDHNAIVAYPTLWYDKGEIKHTSTRAFGHNEKVGFHHAMQNIRWEELYRLQTCEEKVRHFTEVIQSLFETYFPSKTVKRHNMDKPWVTDHYRDLIAQRQYAWLSGNMLQFRKLRNKINRLSRKLEKNFYKRKVEHLKEADNRSWWKHMKSLIGRGASSEKPLESLAQATCNGDMDKFVVEVNNFFKSVGSHIPPLSADHMLFQNQYEVPDEYLVSVSDMERRLSSLKVNKATGPDDIPAWVLKDFAHTLAGPLASIINDSIREGKLPCEWKRSHTIPLPKINPPLSIQSDLRPISITPVAAKAVEYFPIKIISDFSQMKLILTSLVG